MTKEYPWGNGTPKWTYDAGANDSDKSFTVPTGKIWQLKYLFCELATTATVGNRHLALSITNGTNLIDTSYSGIGDIAASKFYGARFLFTGGGYPLKSTDAFRRLSGPTNNQDGTISFEHGERILPAGYVVRVYDINAVDAAADDLTVVLHYIEYDA